MMETAAANLMSPGETMIVAEAGKFPKKDWNDFGLLFIQHGRAICSARKPKCEVCPITALCPKVGV